MSLSMILGLGQTALELALFNALTVLALFLSYSMLNVCDLSTDGCFTLGAAVGAVVAIAGHPWLSIPAAMGAGMLSGFVTATLQTRMGVNSLLAGIIVNTGLYSVNIWIMGGSSLLNMNKTDTVFTMLKDALKGTFLGQQYSLDPELLGLEGVHLKYLLERGILGYAMYLIFYLLLISYIWRHRKSNREEAAGAMCLLVLYLSFAHMTGELKSVPPTLLTLGMFLRLIQNESWKWVQYQQKKFDAQFRNRYRQLS